MLRELRKGTGREKGQTLVLVAVMMMALLGLTAIAVDLSYVFVQRRNMQNAADAGALTGARVVAGFSANPTVSLRHRDIYYEVLRAVQANGARDMEAYLVRCGDRVPYYELGPNDYSAAQRSTACGVWVEASNTFGTFFAQLFTVNELSATAQAQAEFGMPRYANGISPIAVRDTIFRNGLTEIGGSYTFWDSKKQEGGGANRGWLALDCVLPSTGSNCDASAAKLKQWMNPPYYTGQVDNGNFVAGDPGVRTAVLHEAEIPERLIIPVFDTIFHYTSYRYCNRNDPKYNWSKCKAKEEHEGTIPVFTADNKLNGKYYYHVIGFAIFEVTGKGHQGGDKYLTGALTHEVITADWQGPEHIEYANGNHRSFGAAVVKLTQ